jgi:hypothetical protein
MGGAACRGLFHIDLHFLMHRPVSTKDHDAIVFGHNGHPARAKGHGLRLCAGWQRNACWQGGRSALCIKSLLHTGDKHGNHRYDADNHGECKHNHQPF